MKPITDTEISVIENANIINQTTIAIAPTVIITEITNNAETAILSANMQTF
jgi:hypothetical protein